MKSRIFGIAAAAIAALLLNAPPGVSKDLTFGNYLPPTQFTNPHGLVPLFEQLEAATGGSLKFKLYPGGQLFSAKASLVSIGNRIADAGLVVPPFHQSELKNAMVVTDLVFANPDPLTVVAAAIETVLLDCPECQGDYKRRNTIFLIGYGTTEWNLMCKPIVKSLADVQGKKVRSVGAFGRVVKAMGGVPVGMPMIDAVEGVQRGQIDCIIGPFAWMVAYPGADDVVKSVIDHPFGIIGGTALMVMNLDVWKSLGISDRRAILKHAPAATARTMFLGFYGDEVRAAKRAHDRKIVMTEGGSDFQEFMREFTKQDMEIVISRAKKRGVKNPQKIIDAHLANLAKWDKIMAGIPRTPEAYAKALWDEIYAKLDPAKM